MAFQLLIAAHGAHVPHTDRRVLAGREEVLVFVERKLGDGAFVLDQIAHLFRFLQIYEVTNLIAGAGHQQAVRRAGDRLHASVVCMVGELLKEPDFVLWV